MENKEEIKYMRLAIKEANKGKGRTSPNPCVGAVIVKAGRIIGKGYHKKAGAPHAEIEAIRNSVESVRNATIYVTLEPCNHTGKTPPCSRALVESGFSKVVVGMTDPNPLVNGGGLEYLRSQGLEVVSGILEDECKALNYPFIKYIKQGMPWTIMKAGVSLDGRLNYQYGCSGWITGEQSSGEVHKLRNSVDAILVGRKTVEIDNPSLTTRLSRGRGKDPIRVVLDSELSTPLSSNIYHLDSNAPTWIVCACDVAETKKVKFCDLGIKVIVIDRTKEGRLDLRKLMYLLAKEGICSVLVEGGACLHGTFLREELFDYAYLFYAPVFAGDKGVPLVRGYEVMGRATAPRLTNVSYRRLGDDMLISGMLTYR